MTRSLLARRMLRSTAVLIAIAAAIDPAITSNRNLKPEVAVIAGDGPRNAALAGRISRVLARTFTVVSAPSSVAAATVIAGNDLPPFRDLIASPVFAVAGGGDGPAAVIEAVHAPAGAPFQARVPIAATIRATGARGRWLETTLRSGDLVIDRVARAITADDQRVPLSLTFVPGAPGAAALRVTAAITGERSPPETADIVVDVRDTRWAVLFFDPRPTWMSTFVRRALEKDNRFVVTSRVVTARSVSADAGHPPARLDDLAAVGIFDAVVIGAPESLTERDVAGLDAFLRRRGGGVVLLLDQRTAGPYDRLTGITGIGAWAEYKHSKGIAISAGGADGDTLRASEIAWPARLPAGAGALAHSVSSARDGLIVRPVIWKSPVGAGQLLVSGALDAWRYRDHAVSAFDRFWQNAVADAASAAPRRLTLHVANPVLQPGAQTALSVTVRDVALQPGPAGRATVSAFIESDSASAPRRAPIRLWPDGGAGNFSGSFRAPAATGNYRVVVTGDGARAETPLIVAAQVGRATPDNAGLLAAWTTARGGRFLSAPQLAELPALLTAAIHPAPHLERWHPLRAAWWILPFALLLGFEWWLRRRTGLA
jgi:hypothetical protein